MADLKNILNHNVVKNLLGYPFGAHNKVTACRDKSCVCADVHMFEVEAQMNNQYQFTPVERAAALVLRSCTMTTAVTAGICLPPHGTHFVVLILSTCL